MRSVRTFINIMLTSVIEQVARISLPAMPSLPAVPWRICTDCTDGSSLLTDPRPRKGARVGAVGAKGEAEHLACS